MGLILDVLAAIAACGCKAEAVNGFLVVRNGKRLPHELALYLQHNKAMVIRQLQLVDEPEERAAIQAEACTKEELEELNAESIDSRQRRSGC